MEDKPAQREHRLRDVTNQFDYRRPEPISPAGNLAVRQRVNPAILRRALRPWPTLAGSGAQCAYKFRVSLSSKGGEGEDFGVLEVRGALYANWRD